MFIEQSISLGAVLRGTGLLMLTLAIPVSAEQWRVTPIADITLEATDNKLLSSTDERGALGVILRGGARVSYETPTSRAFVQPMLRESRYESDLDLNSTDVLVQGFAQQRWQRASAQMRGSYFYDATLTIRDLNDDDADPLSSVDDLGAGVRLQNRVRRQRLQLQPSGTYELTATDRVTLFADFLDVSFEEGIDTSFVDYRNIEFGVTAEHDFSPHDSLLGTAFVSRFDPDSGNSDVVTYGGLLGVTQGFSPTLDGTLQGGIQWSERDVTRGGVLVGEDVFGFIVDASMRKRWIRTEASARYRRLARPTSGGTVVMRDLAELSVQQRWQNDLTGVVRTRAFRDRNLRSSVGNADFFMQGEALVRWQIDRTWSLEGRYVHARQMSEGGDDASRNSAFLTLRYGG